MDISAITKRLAAHRQSLGPHAALLLDECIAAMHHGRHASVIILAAAILDVALREPAGMASKTDGMTRAAARDSRDAYWLRERRNGIVHYEGGKGGLMGGKDDAEILRGDAERALTVLADSLMILDETEEH